MLILTRHPDQSIMIGDNIVITVIAVNGSNVRIGIKAPKDIPVHREEVRDRIEREASGDLKPRYEHNGNV